jgi:methyl-accepting chemotaxis protein
MGEAFMFQWFGQHAPIRKKFRILLGIYTVLSSIGAATTLYTAAHAGQIGFPVVAAVACSVVAAIVVTTLVAARLICTPYVTTVVRMEALAAGDLYSPVLYTANKDCVGRMTKAMESFRRSSEAAAECNSQRAMAMAMGEGLRLLAAGDLTYRIEAELSGPFAQLKTDFNDAVAALQDTMGSVAHAADGIHKGTGEIRSASDDLSLRTEQQAASLEQTAAAMEEITSTVRKTADDAERANGIVGGARADAQEGDEVVRRAIGAMSDIERSSAEISEIIAVIDSIAFQTNLLALNAGVEAARAGESGRGFAVVASEVRALAQRSADAAKDVKTRITRSSEQVGIGVDLVSESGKSLQRIISRIGEIDALMSTIAASAGQQANGLQQVNTAVAEMDGVTQQNAAMVEQATAATRSLSEEADELAQQVARFKTGTPEAPVKEAVPAAHRLSGRAPAAERKVATARSSGAVLRAVNDKEWSGF